VEKVSAWNDRDAEFGKRAAFALMASVAVHGKKLPDEQFLEWLPLIERASTDERNFVKKAVNWALRQIGKRSMALYHPALELAWHLVESSSKSARWIGRDAARELTNPKTLERVRTK
jgi:3-methyladenine DNA glycosylase AlkD